MSEICPEYVYFDMANRVLHQFNGLYSTKIKIQRSFRNMG
jgi:hypothetical protein